MRQIFSVLMEKRGREMIRCTTIGREPSKLCYEICMIATKCGALKAYEREQTLLSNKTNRSNINERRKSVIK